MLQEHIAWGIMRPVRRLALKAPWKIGNLEIAEPYARVSDYGRAMNVRSLDPDELEAGDVVVNAKRQRPGRLRLVRVGRDDLSKCVSLTVDRRKRRITLVC